MEPWVDPRFKNHRKTKSTAWSLAPIHAVDRMHPNNNAVCDCNINTNIDLLQEYDGDAMKVKGDLIMKKTNKSTLKINDVCYLLGISEIEVWNLIRAGAFPVMLKKGTVRIPEEPFRDWFEFYHLGGVA